MSLPGSNPLGKVRFLFGGGGDWPGPRRGGSLVNFLQIGEGQSCFFFSQPGEGHSFFLARKQLLHVA